MKYFVEVYILHSMANEVSAVVILEGLLFIVLGGRMRECYLV